MPSDQGPNTCPAVAAAAAQLLAWLRDPDSADAAVPGFRGLDLQPVWHAMRADHAENLDIGGGADWPATLAAALEALVVVAGGGHPPERLQHVKRGSSYMVIGMGELQASTPVSEGDRMVVYLGEEGGRLWIRPEPEFRDGRFEAVSG